MLGKFIAREWRGKKIKAVITETEAYVGQNDLACHASRGRTKRSEVLFWEAGYAYVYLIYGMHYCFNVVTEKEGYPAAVLIRGVLMPDGREIKGPGRVCKTLYIYKKFHGRDLIGNKELWFENNPRFKNHGVSEFKSLKVQNGPRIGVEYAGKWAKKPWRFWIERNLLK